MYLFRAKYQLATKKFLFKEKKKLGGFSPSLFLHEVAGKGITEAQKLLMILQHMHIELDTRFIVQDSALKKFDYRRLKMASLNRLRVSLKNSHAASNK